jgi:hypothetical protein
MAVFGKVSFEPLNLSRNELTCCPAMHKNKSFSAVSPYFKPTIELCSPRCIRFDVPINGLFYQYTFD